MNKNKRFIILLLLVLTVGVVFAPMAINALGNSLRLDNKEYWRYDADKNSKVTSRQVADLLYNNELSGGTEVSVPESDEQAAATVRILNTVFGSNEIVCDYMKNIAKHSLRYFSKDSILTVINNNSVALNVISVGYSRGDENIEFAFEEKTQTLIYFQYYVPGGDSTVSFPEDAFMLSVHDYYSRIEIPEDRYYLKNDLKKGTWIYFGLENKPLEYVEEDKL